MSTGAGAVRRVNHARPVRAADPCLVAGLSLSGEADPRPMGKPPSPSNDALASKSPGPFNRYSSESLNSIGLDQTEAT